MKPRTSRLRTKIVFLALTEASDGGGGHIEGFFAPPGFEGGALCDLRPVSARRVMTEAVEVMKRSTAHVRAEAVPPGVDATWRAEIGGESYSILDCTDPDQDGRFLTLILQRNG